MNVKPNRWKPLFLFCLGLFIAAAFCMKWMENDLLVNGEKFTIMGLELFYPKEKIIAIMTGLDERVRTILRYHLHFDFVFMAGVFPGIASLCMMARRKSSPGLFRNILLVLAILQPAAWAGDIYENLSLLKWIDNPIDGDEFATYHVIVAAKWIIALMGAFVAITLLLFTRKKN
jgi:hypothetical protein